MQTFNIVITRNAENDIDNYIDFIIYHFKAPITALRHYEGLFREINRLKKIALSIPISNQQSLIETYGFGVRRINYKKMAIVYTVYKQTVIIKAVVSQSNIKGV